MAYCPLCGRHLFPPKAGNYQCVACGAIPCDIWRSPQKKQKEAPLRRTKKNGYNRTEIEVLPMVQNYRGDKNCVIRKCGRQAKYLCSYDVRCGVQSLLVRRVREYCPEHAKKFIHYMGVFQDWIDVPELKQFGLPPIINSKEADNG